MLDAAKYITPVVESTLPIGGDRYMIRGFQVSHEFVDGTEISGQDGYSASMLNYNIERIEIIKGPNAILVPGGSPGGVMNPITKAPFGKDATKVTLGLSHYSGNTVDLDLNRVLTRDGKLSARLVYSLWRTDYYINGQYRNGYEIAPSLSYQLSPSHKLTLKTDFVQNRETNLGGLPLDPSVGVTEIRKVGTQVKQGEPLIMIHYNDEAKVDAALPYFRDAYRLAPKRPNMPPLVVERVA